MFKSVFRKHCSDEVLLAHLDGELTLRRDRSAKKHLATCWECRARLAELEEQAQDVTRALAEQSFPERASIEEAKRKFLNWRQEFERNRLLSPQNIDAFSFTARLGLASAVVLLCAIGVARWVMRRETTPKSLEVLVSTQNYEAAQTPGTAAFHRGFRVEIVSLRPPKPTVVRQLDIWSEPTTGRFAARWTDQSGALQAAVWHPIREREYVYSLATKLRLVPFAPMQARTASLEEISTNGLSPEQLQDGFMTWLEGQHWRPTFFSSGMASFASESGVILHAERVRAPDGHEAIRLTAERTKNGRRIQVTMDIEASNYRPTLQTIRFETPEQVVELRLTAERTELLTEENSRPALFQPDLELMAVHNVVQPNSKTAEFALSSAQLATLEVDVLHSLDQIGAVLGEEVTVRRTPKGTLRVQATLEAEHRKEEILSALERFKGNPAIELNISTVAEAEVARQSRQSARGAVTLPELEVTREATPVFAELRRLFSESDQSKLLPPDAKRQNPAKQDEEIRRFAKRTLDESQQALLHAWALKHFVERLSAEEQRALPQDAYAKWRGLLHEHALGFRKETEMLRVQLQPIFSPNSASLSSSGKNSVEERETTGVGIGGLQGAELSQAIDRLFEMATSHDEALRSAFVISAESQSLDTIKSPDFFKSLRDSETLARRIEGGAK